MKKVFLMMAVLVMVFAGCKKEKANFTEKIIGKWMIAEMDGSPVGTNKKQVFTFTSSSKASVSTSIVAKPGMPSLWMDHLETEVLMGDNKVTLTSHPNESTKILDEITVTAINDKEFTANRKLTMYKDGEVSFTTDMPIRFVKVTVDYSQSIIGMWEGHVTSEMGSEFDDGEEHRWEYLADGNFHFYRLVNGEWQLSNDEFSNYFVDGSLLCTRWKNNGENTEEKREWWEIASIENGVMNWTAFRQREDGTTYTATFSMTKVR